MMMVVVYLDEPSYPTYLKYALLKVKYALGEVVVWQWHVRPHQNENHHLGGMVH
jgi:hypothetical protein